MIEGRRTGEFEGNRAEGIRGEEYCERRGIKVTDCGFHSAKRDQHRGYAVAGVSGKRDSAEDGVGQEKRSSLGRSGSS